MNDQPWSAHETLKVVTISAAVLAEHLSDRRTLFMLEGGIVYSCRYHGQPCLVTGEGTMEDFAPELAPIEPRLRIFWNEEHREAFISANGWAGMREK